MHASSLVALLLAATVPQSPAAGPPALEGTWTGSGTLTFEDAGSSCRYSPAPESEAVTLRLESLQSGSIALDLPAAGESCPAIKRTHAVTAARISDNSLSVSDNAGHEWSLTLREGRLKGMVAGGTLSGEVDLAREVPAGIPPTGAASATAPPATPKGSVLKGTGGFIAANVVGLGALVGLNYALKDKQQSTTAVKCSLRSCLVIAGECSCNGAPVNGGSCGNTASGVAFRNSCNPPDLPCQSDLSCDNNVCEEALVCQP
jgi:hypothetical protein